MILRIYALHNMHVFIQSCLKLALLSVPSSLIFNFLVILLVGKMKFLIEIGSTSVCLLVGLQKVTFTSFFNIITEELSWCRSFRYYGSNKKSSLKLKLSHIHKPENSKIVFFLKVNTIDEFFCIKVQYTSFYSLYLAKKVRKLELLRFSI